MVYLIYGVDICSGTLLTLSLSLKIDQNRLGFSLISCSNDSKNLVRLSRIVGLTVDRNCLNLARKQGEVECCFFLRTASFISIICRISPVIQGSESLPFIFLVGINLRTVITIKRLFPFLPRHVYIPTTFHDVGKVNILQSRA